MASHNNPGDLEYVPPSLDQALSSADDPFASATQGLDALDDIVDSVVPAADLEVGTSGNAPLAFQESQLGNQYVTGKIGGSSNTPAPAASVPASSAVPAATAVPTAASPSPVDELQQKFSRFNIKYYRDYFNVDTQDVGMRMLDSMLCIVRPNFLEKHGQNPDLYGPFWISTTIVFLIAVVSNYIGWQNHGGHGEAATAAWKYDVDKVSISAALFYGYVGAVGFVIWAVLRWFKSAVTLPEIWCIYGYGLAIFIPISILCAIPSALASWLLVGISTLLSGLFILLNLRVPVFESAGAKALPLYIAMGCCHAGLGFALKFYFFRYAKLH